MFTKITAEKKIKIKMKNYCYVKVTEPATVGTRTQFNDQVSNVQSD